MDRLVKSKEQFEGPSAFVPCRSVECFLLHRDRSILHNETHDRPSSRPGRLKHLSLHSFVYSLVVCRIPLAFGHSGAFQMCSPLPRKITLYPASAERAMSD